MKVPKFILRFIGHAIARKLGLKEDSEMDDKKKWYKSKTTWGGIVVFLVNVYDMVGASIGPLFGFDLPVIPDFMITILNALLGIQIVHGRATATKKIG